MGHEQERDDPEHHADSERALGEGAEVAPTSLEARGSVENGEPYGALPSIAAASASAISSATEVARGSLAGTQKPPAGPAGEAAVAGGAAAEASEATLLGDGEAGTIVLDETGVPLLVEGREETVAAPPAPRVGGRITVGLPSERQGGGSVVAEPVGASERISAAEQDQLIREARERAAELWSRREAPPPERHMGLWMLTSASLLIAVFSLVLNAALLSALGSRRAELQRLLDDASAGVEQAAASGISLEFPVKETIHFEGDIPIQQDFDFPVNTTIAVNTTVSVPVDLGALGTISVSVPINTSVPVNTAVPVHVDQTIHVATDIPVEMTVPIRLAPDQPPLSDLIEAARAFLGRLEQLL